MTSVFSFMGSSKKCETRELCRPMANHLAILSLQLSEVVLRSTGISLRPDLTRTQQSCCTLSLMQTSEDTEASFAPVKESLSSLAFLYIAASPHGESLYPLYHVVKLSCLCISTDKTRIELKKR